MFLYINLDIFQRNGKIYYFILWRNGRIYHFFLKLRQNLLKYRRSYGEIYQNSDHYLIFFLVWHVLDASIPKETAKLAKTKPKKRQDLPHLFEETAEFTTISSKETAEFTTFFWSYGRIYHFFLKLRQNLLKTHRSCGRIYQNNVKNA